MIFVHFFATRLLVMFSSTCLKELLERWKQEFCFDMQLVNIVGLYGTLIVSLVIYKSTFF